MELIITSFKTSRIIQNSVPSLTDTKFYSVSRWQPSGFKYDELTFLSACDINGNRLHQQRSPQPNRHATAQSRCDQKNP